MSATTAGIQEPGAPLPEPRTKCPIVLVDPSPLRRAALARLLEHWTADEEAGFTVTHAVASPGDVPQGENISLLLVSIGGVSVATPQISDLLNDLRQQCDDAPLVVMSDRNDAPGVVAALKAGARGFITSDIEPHLMFNALKFIAHGGVFFPPEALLTAAGSQVERIGTTALYADAPAEGPASITALTTRQRKVLDLLRQGQSNKRIAIELGMCESTVKVHVRHIMRKLGATNRTQAALNARDLDLAAEPPVLPAQLQQQDLQLA